MRKRTVHLDRNDHRRSKDVSQDLRHSLREWLPNDARGLYYAPNSKWYYPLSQRAYVDLIAKAQREQGRTVIVQEVTR